MITPGALTALADVLCRDLRRRVGGDQLQLQRVIEDLFQCGAQMEGSCNAALVSLPVNELLAVEDAHVFKQPLSEVGKDFIIQIAPHLAGILQVRLHLFVVIPVRECAHRGISGPSATGEHLLLGGRLPLDNYLRQAIAFLPRVREAQVRILAQGNLLLLAIQAITEDP